MTTANGYENIIELFNEQARKANQFGRTLVDTTTKATLSQIEASAGLANQLTSAGADLIRSYTDGVTELLESATEGVRAETRKKE